MSGRRLKRCKTLTSFSFVEISELEVKGLGASTSSTRAPDGTLRRQEPFHRECFYVTGTRLSYLLFTFPQSSSFKEARVVSLRDERASLSSLQLQPHTRD